jgi:ATP-dependent DNA helicase RecG
MTDIVDMAERARTAISLGESHFREFKSATKGPPGEKIGRSTDEIGRDVAEALVAFANADGGELLIGVEDDGQVSGMSQLSEAQIETLLNAPKTLVHKDTPLSSVRARQVEIDGKRLLYFSVAKSASGIHLTSKGHCVQRRDLETLPVPPDQIVFERRERTSREYDREFVDGASTDALDLALVRAVATQLSPGMSAERCLQYLDLAEYAPTGLKLRRAALLLFSREPARWHPRLQIRTMKINGTELLTGDSYNVLTDDVQTGNILRLIEEGWERLRPHLVQTRLGESARFETTVMYPELACREALVNAIAHRDYSDEGKGIEIYVYSDRMEVRSPGSLLSTIKIDDLLRLEGVHQSRNALVCRVLRELGYMRELGEGMRRIFDLMSKNELTEPELKNTSTAFSMSLHYKTVYSADESLWLDQFSALELTREQKALVVLGRNGRIIAPQDIWDKLGLVDTEHYRRLVESLQKLGVLSTVVPKQTANNKAKARGVPVRKIPRFAILPPGAGGARRSERRAPTRRLTPTAEVDAPDPNARLWIGSVGDASEAELTAFFAEVGPVQDVRVPMQAGTPVGYAFVEYETQDQAKEAIKRFNGVLFKGRRLVVRPANPRNIKF